MNAEKKKALQLLKTAKGQTDGIIKMIEDERYCVDVSDQLAAVQALLRKSQTLILKQHIEHCVKEACLEGQGEEKLAEIMKLMEKVMK